MSDYTHSHTNARARGAKPRRRKCKFAAPSATPGPLDPNPYGQDATSPASSSIAPTGSKISIAAFSPSSNPAIVACSNGICARISAHRLVSKPGFLTFFLPARICAHMSIAPRGTSPRGSARRPLARFRNGRWKQTSGEPRALARARNETEARNSEARARNSYGNTHDAGKDRSVRMCAHV